MLHDYDDIAPYESIDSVDPRYKKASAGPMILPPAYKVNNYQCEDIQTRSPE